MVQPGVVNLDVTLAVQAEVFLCSRPLEPARLHHRRQRGGERRRSAHPGLRRDHQSRARARVVLPDGTVFETGGPEPDLPGYDLTGLLTGSEGTMVLVTTVVVRLMRQAEIVKTVLAIYDRPKTPGYTVTEITSRAITPVAVEMLDGVMLRMVEEATHAGYPMDAAAVLLIELEGVQEAVEEQLEQVREACAVCRAREFRVARTAAERDCCGRVARTRSAPSAASARPTTCRTAWCRERRSPPRCAISPTCPRSTALTISNIFHAGDGNMHPIILFDPRKRGRTPAGAGGWLRHPALLHLGGRVDHGRARGRHGEDGADAGSVQLPGP